MTLPNINKPTTALVCLSAILAVFVFADEVAKPNFKPKGGYVPDAKTAIKIAVAVWEPIYGEKGIADEKPYQATLDSNGIWTVTGSLPPGMNGGTAVAEIAKDDGKILRIIHEK